MAIPVELTQGSLETVYTLNKTLIYGTFPPIVKFHGSRNEWMGMGEAIHIVTPSDPLKFCFLFL